MANQIPKHEARRVTIEIVVTGDPAHLDKLIDVAVDAAVTSIDLLVETANDVDHEEHDKSLVARFGDFSAYVNKVTR